VGATHDFKAHQSELPWKGWTSGNPVHPLRGCIL